MRPTPPPRRSVRDLLVPPAPRDVTVVPEGEAGVPTARNYELFGATPEARRVVGSGPGYAIMEDQFGNQFRVEGSRPWRNNNPGNIRNNTGFARRHGGIGEDREGFAVFPSPETGEEALRTLLFQPDSRYRNLRPDSVVSTFAPPKDKNDTPRYQKFVRKLVGTNEPVSKLTDAQREALISAIMRFEGYPKGGTVKMDDREWASRPMP